MHDGNRSGRGPHVGSWPFARPVARSVPFITGCAGIEGDIKRAQMREVFLDLTRGKDRGVGYYTETISGAKTEIVGGRYQHQPPAHISHFLIARSVRGLGGTNINSSDDLALAVFHLGLRPNTVGPLGLRRGAGARALPPAND